MWGLFFNQLCVVVVLLLFPSCYPAARGLDKAGKGAQEGSQDEWRMALV